MSCSSENVNPLILKKLRMSCELKLDNAGYKNFLCFMLSDSINAGTERLLVILQRFPPVNKSFLAGWSFFSNNR